MKQDESTLIYRLTSDQDDFGPSSLLVSDLLNYINSLQDLYSLLAKDLSIDLPEVFLSLETIEPGSVCAGLRLSEETQDVDKFLSNLTSVPELWEQTSTETREHIRAMQDSLHKRQLGAEIYGFSTGQSHEVRIHHLSEEVMKWEKSTSNKRLRDVMTRTTVYGRVTSVNLEKKTAYLKTRLGKLMLKKVEGEVLKTITRAIDDNLRLKARGYCLWLNNSHKFGAMEPINLSLIEPVSNEAWGAFNEHMAIDSDEAIEMLTELGEFDSDHVG